MKLKKYKLAVEFCKLSIDRIEKSLPFGHLDISQAHNAASVAYGYLDQHEKALGHHMIALENAKDGIDPMHMRIATFHTNTGNTFARSTSRRIMSLSFFIDKRKA